MTCFRFFPRTLSRNIRIDRGSMPQEMSSGGMDRWIVEHEEKTRRARREGEGGEGEECRAPKNSEWILFLAFLGKGGGGWQQSGASFGVSCPFFGAEGENVAPCLTQLSPAFALHMPAVRRPPRLTGHMTAHPRVHLSSLAPCTAGGRSRAGARRFDPSVIDARACVRVATVVPFAQKRANVQETGAQSLPSPPDSCNLRRLYLSVTREVGAQLGESVTGCDSDVTFLERERGKKARILATPRARDLTAFASPAGCCAYVRFCSPLQRLFFLHPSFTPSLPCPLSPQKTLTPPLHQL